MENSGGWDTCAEFSQVRKWRPGKENNLCEAREM